MTHRIHNQALNDPPRTNVNVLPELAGNIPRQTRQSARGHGAGQLPNNDVREHIDISLSNENSDASQDDDPPAAPSLPITASSAMDASFGQPAPAPSSQGSHSRNVAHDINHFFRRGKKSQQGSQTVCTPCE
jgi:hypothetical protein